MIEPLKIAYADPPYPNCAHLYKGQPEYVGEIDHEKLAKKLLTEYDGFILHTSSTALRFILPMFPDPEIRIMSWVKPFATFKRNVSVAYAWEPVLVRSARKPKVSHRIVMRDWVSQSITLKKGLVGAKPPVVCEWAFEMLGALPIDYFDDLYPGTGIVKKTWDQWCKRVNMLGYEEETE